ncbi:MAG: hypothetical protein AAGE98_11925 [Actinomycetota bacterium]
MAVWIAARNEQVPVEVSHTPSPAETSSRSSVELTMIVVVSSDAEAGDAISKLAKTAVMAKSQPLRDVAPTGTPLRAPAARRQSLY